MIDRRLDSSSSRKANEGDGESLGLGEAGDTAEMKMVGVTLSGLLYPFRPSCLGSAKKCQGRCLGTVRGGDVVC